MLRRDEAVQHKFAARAAAGTVAATRVKCRHAHRVTILALPHEPCVLALQGRVAPRQEGHAPRGGEHFAHHRGEHGRLGAPGHRVVHAPAIGHKPVLLEQVNEVQDHACRRASHLQDEEWAQVVS